MQAAVQSVADTGGGPALDAGPALLRHMVRARVISARLTALQRAGTIGYHHSSIGLEAAIVGAVLGARSTDWVFPGPREWYVSLARGMELERHMHHAWGSAADPAKGHSPPDHAPARAFRVVPPSGVAGAHLPQAVGAAWAAKIRRDDVAMLAFFEDSVADAGDFHNALNFAGVFKVPVVFVCRSRGTRRVLERANAYGIASAQVDGGDALAVFSLVQAAIARAPGGGATILEVVEPVFPDLEALPDQALADGDVLDLGEKDPLGVLRRALHREKRLELGAQETLADEARADLTAAIAAAEAAGLPAAATMFDDVYASVPSHLVAQRRSLT